MINPNDTKSYICITCINWQIFIESKWHPVGVTKHHMCFKRYRYGGTIWVYCGITDNVPSWSMGYIGVKQRDRKRERKERERNLNDLLYFC